MLIVISILLQNMFYWHHLSLAIEIFGTYVQIYRSERGCRGNKGFMRCFKHEKIFRIIIYYFFLYILEISINKHTQMHIQNVCAKTKLSLHSPLRTAANIKPESQSFFMEFLPHWRLLKQLTQRKISKYPRGERSPKIVFIYLTEEIILSVLDTDWLCWVPTSLQCFVRCKVDLPF